MVQWVDRAPPEFFMRATRVLHNASKTMPAVLNAWANQGRELMVLLYDRRDGLQTALGGPNGIMRTVESVRGGPRTEAIRDALEAVWKATEFEADSLPALIAWECATGDLEMVAMLIDPKAFDGDLS